MRRAALAYTKNRSRLGLAGIQASQGLAEVVLAREWPSEDIPRVAGEIAALHERNDWGQTFIDLEAGDYLAGMLRREALPVQVITSQKKVKDASKIQGLRVMDRIEATEFLRKLKLAGQLKWPARPSGEMRLLEAQMPFFSKHVTEAGAVDYYAPGEEPDGLVRALIISCFAARQVIEQGMTGHVMGGVTGRIRPSVPMGTVRHMRQYEEDVLRGIGDL